VVALLLAVIGLSGCWSPPGEGVPKGCISQFQIAGELSAGLGLSSHIEWGDSRTETAYRDFEQAKWSELGVGTARTDFKWSRIEPERGSFDFTGLDRVVAAGEASNTEMLAILNYGNSWARADGESTAPPDNLSDFADYAATVAEHYAGRVRHYEIWNEQNIGLTFWRPEEDPVRYGELLALTSERVRQVDPEALISFGGVFGPYLLLNTEGEEYVRQVAAALPDLSEHIDIMAFHPYRYPFSAPEVETENQRSLANEVCSMRELMGEFGAGDLPLWITELGWHTALDSFSPGVDDTTQGAYLARSALISMSQGVERFYWYTFRDSGTASDDQEQRFGLFSYDEVPGDGTEAVAKSAAEFATLSAVLDDHNTLSDRSEDLGFDEESWAIELAGGTAPSSLALWTAGPPETVELGRNLGNTLLDTAGNELPLSGTPLAWQIELTGRPVYLLSR
jgi:polysaccharide biosynthesis protein PslG